MKMEHVGCPETSGTTNLRCVNIPEERIAHSRRGTSLKFTETHWNSLKFTETHWNSLKFTHSCNCTAYFERQVNSFILMCVWLWVAKVTYWDRVRLGKLTVAQLVALPTVWCPMFSTIFNISYPLHTVPLYLSNICSGYMLPSMEIQNAAFPVMYVILFTLMRATGPTRLPYFHHSNNFWRGLEFSVFIYTYI
jgi:hypothetical protein